MPGDDAFTRSFTFRLTMARERANLRRDQVARYLGVNSRTVERWETGRTAIPVKMLGAVCCYYSVTSDWLIGVDK